MNPVRQSFNRAALSYDQMGALQHEVATALIAFISSQLPSGSTGRLLDAGSGTGDCLVQLHSHYPAAEFIAVDFAECMLQQLPVKPRISRILADLQQLPINAGTINVYLSSLAWQWCDPVRAAREASRVLQARGDFFITTLTTGTFAELSHALLAGGLNPDQHLLPCASVEDIQAALSTSGLEVLHHATTRITTWHSDFRSLRHSIRGVGANHLPLKTPPRLNRNQRAALVDACESLRTTQGLPLSYEVLTMHARKP